MLELKIFHKIESQGVMNVKIELHRLTGLPHEEAQHCFFSPPTLIVVNGTPKGYN